MKKPSTLARKLSEAATGLTFRSRSAAQVVAGATKARGAEALQAGAKAVELIGTTAARGSTAARESATAISIGVVEGGKAAAVVGRRAAGAVASSTKALAEQVAASAAEAGALASRSIKTVVVTVVDVNGDGQLDQADLKLITEKSVAVLRSAGKGIASSDLAKEAATGAAIGAAIAVPIPLVGPVGGAAAGAIVGVVLHARKGKGKS